MFYALQKMRNGKNAQKIYTIPKQNGSIAQSHFTSYCLDFIIISQMIVMPIGKILILKEEIK